ncbi:MAG: NRDE family protein [Woeseiaceae bacterium]|nr:NRDE family protein [Woeseiaceae bacterium]
MCLIAFAWCRHPRYRLILAANRDELYARPADPMHWWPDRPGVLAGRDLQAGGTWLAVSRGGRLATVTDFREDFRVHTDKRSRGELVTGFVDGERAPLEYARDIDGDRYAGFSLLVAADDSLACVDQAAVTPRASSLSAIDGLSNATLDTPWPKLRRTRDALADMIDEDAVNPAALFRLLAD